MSNTFQERAILATLHVGAWSGHCFDRSVTDEISQLKKAEDHAGRYNKRLVASHFMQPVMSVEGTARRIHKQLTLPWEDNGTRILATPGYMAYTGEMRLLRIKYEAAVTQWAKGMPQYIEEAKVRLGKMFNAEDYPDVKDVTAKFWFDVEVKQVPESKDFRAKLSNDAVKEITHDIEKRTNDRLEMAMNEVFSRIAGLTAHMVDKLKNFQPAVGDKKIESNFRDSMVWNIKELAELLPALNLTNDKRIEDLRLSMLNDLTVHSPVILKADPKVRSETARKAEAILKKVNSYMA